MSGPFELAIWPPDGVRGRVRQLTFTTWADLARYLPQVHKHARIAVREKEDK